MGNDNKPKTRAEEKHLREQQIKELLQFEAFKKEKIERYLKGDPKHKMPTTRRQFLEAGVISTSGFILGPTIASLAGKLSAEAAEIVCPAPNATTGPAPFVHLHFSGGFNVLAGAVPRTTAGARLANYSDLGLGATPTFQTAFANGAEFFDAGANLGLYQGIITTAQASTIANAAWVTIPYSDNGDSSDPARSAIGLVNAAGRAGDKLGLLGTDNTATGSGDAPNPAFNIVPIRPLVVNSVATVLQAVQFAGALSNLTQAQQLSLATTIRDLSSSQAAKITGLNGGMEVGKLVECATDQNLKNLQGGGQALDPNQVTGMAGIWNNFVATNLNGSGSNINNTVAATMVMNVLNGNAAACAFEVGGYDIHNDSNQGGSSATGRAFQEVGAFKIGQIIGRTLETARLLNRKVFIHITTNGSNNVGGNGTVNDSFTSDSSDFSGSHFIAYDPAKAVVAASAQIGGLSNSGSVDDSQFTADVQNAAAAMFLNYCIFSGNEALFDKVLAGRFNATQKAFMRKLAA